MLYRVLSAYNPIVYVADFYTRSEAQEVIDLIYNTAATGRRFIIVEVKEED
jgi:hypothetical protein